MRKTLALALFLLSSLAAYAQDSDIIVTIKPKENVLSRCLHSREQSAFSGNSFRTGQSVTVNDDNGEVSYSIDFDVQGAIYSCMTEEEEIEFLPVEVSVRLNPTYERIDNPIFDPHFIEKLRISVFAFVIKNLNNALVRVDVLSFTRQIIGADLRSPVASVHAIEIGKIELEMASSEDDFAFLFDLKISLGMAVPQQGLVFDEAYERLDDSHDMVDRVSTAFGIRFNRFFNAKIFGSFDMLTSALVQVGYGAAFNFLPTRSTELSLQVEQRHIFVNGAVSGSTDPAINATTGTLNFRVYFDR